MSQQQKQPRASPAEGPSIARKVMADALAFYLQHGGPAIARAHIERLAQDLIFYPDTSIAYVDAQMIIDRTESGEKVEQCKSMAVIIEPGQETKPQQPETQPTQTDDTAPAEPEAVLPPELRTEKAMKIWKRAQKANIIDDHYQPCVSRTSSAVFAEKMARYLGIDPKWKVFETLWNRKNMRADYNEALGQKKTTKLLDQLKIIFDDL